MSDTVPPSATELLWRLEAVTRAQERTAERLDELNKSLEASYVGRREFELRVGVLEEAAKNAAGSRRQVAAGALILFLGIIVNLVVSLSRIPGVS